MQKRSSQTDARRQIPLSRQRSPQTDARRQIPANTRIYRFPTRTLHQLEVTRRQRPASARRHRPPRTVVGRELPASTSRRMSLSQIEETIFQTSYRGRAQGNQYRARGDSEAWNLWRLFTSTKIRLLDTSSTNTDIESTAKHNTRAEEAAKVQTRPGSGLASTTQLFMKKQKGLQEKGGQLTWKQPRG